MLRYVLNINILILFSCSFNTGILTKSELKLLNGIEKFYTIKYGEEGKILKYSSVLQKINLKVKNYNDLDNYENITSIYGKIYLLSMFYKKNSDIYNKKLKKMQLDNLELIDVVYYCENEKYSVKEILNLIKSGEFYKHFVIY